MYFGLSYSILQKEYNLARSQTTRVENLPGLFAIAMFAGASMYAAQVRVALLRQLSSYALAVLGISALLGGFFVSAFLFVFCALKAAASVVELILVPWSAFPWRGSVLTGNKTFAGLRTPPSDVILHGYDQVSSADRLIWPQHIYLLTCSACRMTATAHANLQALAFLSLTGVCTIVAQIPVAVVMMLGLVWGMLALVLDLSFTTKGSLLGQFLLAAALITPGFLARYLVQGRFRAQMPSNMDHAFINAILKVNFGSLHNWFVMNEFVARSIIEKYT